MKTLKLKLTPNQKYPVAENANAITIEKSLAKIRITSEDGGTSIEMEEGQRIEGVVFNRFFVENLSDSANEVTLVAGRGKFTTSAGLAQLTTSNINELGSTFAQNMKTGDPQPVNMNETELDYLAAKFADQFDFASDRLVTFVKNGYLDEVRKFRDHDNELAYAGKILNRVASRQIYSDAELAFLKGKVMPTGEIYTFRNRLSVASTSAYQEARPLISFAIPAWALNIDGVVPELYITKLRLDSEGYSNSTAEIRTAAFDPENKSWTKSGETGLVNAFFNASYVGRSARGILSDIDTNVSLSYTAGGDRNLVGFYTPTAHESKIPGGYASVAELGSAGVDFSDFPLLAAAGANDSGSKAFIMANTDNSKMRVYFEGFLWLRPAELPGVVT